MRSVKLKVLEFWIDYRFDFQNFIKKSINSDPVAVFTFEIVLNREMQAKYYAAISLPIGLDAKLSCQRIIFLIGLKCVCDSIQICPVRRCNFGTKSKHLLSLASCY